jgi:uncharacterized membrane protein YgdD (TMEM256/DUF423 family)
VGRGWISAGAACCAAAVVAGAFGAHGLRARLDARGLELWETAARYLFYGGVGVVLAGLFGLHGARPGLGAATAGLFAGALVFSGTVFALALGGPRWLGAVTPLGGLLLVAGFVLFAWTAAR